MLTNPVGENLIVSLDIDDYDCAMSIVKALGCSVNQYKVHTIGLQYPHIIDELLYIGKWVMYDGKFRDIPRTIQKYINALAYRGVQAATFSLENDLASLQKMIKKTSVSGIGVGNLTSTSGNNFNQQMMFKRGIESGITSFIVRAGDSLSSISDQNHNFSLYVPGCRINPDYQRYDQIHTISAACVIRAGNKAIVGSEIYTSDDPLGVVMTLQEQCLAK